MSEVKTEANEKKRDTYVLDIERDAFKPNYDGKYLTSIEFCKLANQIFKAAFCNYNGCKIVANQGQPSMELYFTHVDNIPEPTVDQETGEQIVYHVATQRFGGNTVGSSLIDKTRNRDNRMINGDRYTITEDGADIIKPLLFPRLYNHGKPNWNQIITEISDQSANGYYAQMNVLQLTKISGIDPKRVAALIWGRSDEDGEIDYGIAIMRDLTINTGYGMPGSSVGTNFALDIKRAHTKSISNTYESMGLGQIGSSIVRS